MNQEVRRDICIAVMTSVVLVSSLPGLSQASRDESLSPPLHLKVAVQDNGLIQLKQLAQNLDGNDYISEDDGGIEDSSERHADHSEERKGLPKLNREGSVVRLDKLFDGFVMSYYYRIARN